VRISLVIATLAAIAVGMVHLRRAQTRAHHQIHRLQIDQIHLRARLYDQQQHLGVLTAPKQVDERARRMDVRLTHRLGSSAPLAAHAGGGPGAHATEGNR